VWLGGLVVLGVALAPGAATAGAATPAGLAQGLPRWSRLAMGSVVVLVVTGTLQAWRQIGEVAAITGTDYGRYLLVKVALLVGLLSVAQSSRRIVARRLTGRLRRHVGTELALGAVVLAVTTVLVNAVPARESFTAPFTTTVTAHDTQGRNATLLLEMTSTRSGPSIVHLYSYTADGAVLPFSIVTATLTEQTKKLGPVALTFTTVARGHAQAATVVPAAGSWQLTTQVITDGVTDYAATTTVDIR
jgi:copper transport protein